MARSIAALPPVWPHQQSNALWPFPIGAARWPQTVRGDADL